MRLSKISILVILFSLLLCGCASQPLAGTNQQAGQPDGQQVLPGASTSGTGDKNAAPFDKSDPSNYLVRSQYFREVFMPDRENYKLFEKAAAFTQRPISQMPAMFALDSELEIFSSLPPVPKDFSDVAFLLASGKTYDIGSLGEEYYKQPEFYPNFKEFGLRYWEKPDPTTWSSGGYGVYPAEQLDTLSLSGRNDFSAAAFIYTGYGVQTYQGFTIIPDAKTLENFDIKITPNTFLLGPSFPKFDANWAQSILITGSLKEGAAPGVYAVGFEIVPPPKEKQDEWGFKHRNLYYNASSGISPSGNPLKFTITVKD